MPKNIQLINYADKYPMFTYIYGHDVNYWKTHKDEWLKIASLHEWKLCKPESVSKQEPKPEQITCSICYGTGKVDKPKQPCFKVGDCVTDGVITGRISEAGHDGYKWVKDAHAVYHISVDNLKAVSPFDVVVKIGCLSGTVRKHANCNYLFVIRHPATDYCSLISKDALDNPTREFVEAILKAQEKP